MCGAYRYRLPTDPANMELKLSRTNNSLYGRLLCRRAKMKGHMRAIWGASNCGG
jgi:hypothetical protein